MALKDDSNRTISTQFKLRAYALEKFRLGSNPDDYQVLNSLLGSFRKELTKAKPNVEELLEDSLLGQSLIPDMVGGLNSEQFFSFLTSFASSDRPLFVTGNAGTGKSHLLRTISRFAQQVGWNVAVVAPTGIAAINVGGMTIHKLFRLHTHKVLEEKAGSAATNQGFPVGGFQKGHEPLLRELDLVIVDELSMVRADVLDAIDRKLRHARRSNQLFGGVRVLFFGDLLQLPPIQDRAWRVNAAGAGYLSPYPIAAKALSSHPLRVFELSHNVRVSNGEVSKDSDDARYVEILGRLRRLEVRNEDLEFLNSKCLVTDSDPENLQIHTRNDAVNLVNESRLKQLKTPLWERTASAEGRFQDYMQDEDFDGFPADLTLRLKVGARVMFIKNDDQNQDPEWANGSLGTVEAFTDSGVLVRLNSGPTVVAGRSTWELIKYQLREYRGQDGNLYQIVEPQVEGKFRQYPLRLAWAATIHKSQGQTFDRITVDLGDGVWEPGQAYVALSRVTSLKGLQLMRPLNGADFIKPDPVVSNFLASGRISFSVQDVEKAREKLSVKVNKYVSTLSDVGLELLQVKNDFERAAALLAEAMGSPNHISRYILSNDSRMQSLFDQLTSGRRPPKEQLGWLSEILRNFNSFFEDRALVLKGVLEETRGEPDTTVITAVFSALFPGQSEPHKIISKLNRSELSGTALESHDYPARRAILLDMFSKKSVKEVLNLLANVYLAD